MKGAKVHRQGRRRLARPARTNGKGVAVIADQPAQAGDHHHHDVVESNQKLCGAKRIGVVGVFLPPLTG